MKGITPLPTHTQLHAYVEGENRSRWWVQFKLIRLTTPSPWQCSTYLHWDGSRRTRASNTVRPSGPLWLDESLHIVQSEVWKEGFVWGGSSFCSQRKPKNKIIHKIDVLDHFWKRSDGLHALVLDVHCSSPFTVLATVPCSLISVAIGGAFPASGSHTLAVPAIS